MGTIGVHVSLLVFISIMHASMHSFINSCKHAFIHSHLLLLLLLLCSLAMAVQHAMKNGVAPTTVWGITDGILPGSDLAQSSTKFTNDEAQRVVDIAYKLLCAQQQKNAMKLPSKFFREGFCTKMKVCLME